MKQLATDPHLRPNLTRRPPPPKKTQVVLDGPFLLALRVSQELAN